MSAFLDCISCSGFVPHDTAVCPHCGEAVAKKSPRRPAARGGLFGKVLTAAAGGLMSLTLMACYGIAYNCDEQPPDDDGDGWDTESGYGCGDSHPEPDCDDTDATIYPGAPDSLGDNIDQNCDGVDGVVDGTGGAAGSMGGAGGSTGGAGGTSTGGAGGSTGGAGGMSTGGAGGSMGGAGGAGGG